jgi:phosphate acetyltransferase
VDPRLADEARPRFIDAAHPRLAALVVRAAAVAAWPRVAIVHPCDVAAMQAAAAILAAGIARPVLVGARERIARAAGNAAVDVAAFELIDVSGVGDAAADARAAAAHAAQLARDGAVDALMKGSLHTDELMSAVVRREAHLRTERRISHAFVFDAPRYPKLIALADCVVNIAPDLRTKRDILVNASVLLRGALGVTRPKVAVVAAVEIVNPLIAATVDAAALVEEAARGDFGDVIVEGPLGFDNAISAEAARTKGLDSVVAGDADLLVVPDLNAGNLLYKSFVYIGGAECAGVVLGARVPLVLTSRADSLAARVASVALASLAVEASSRS